MFDEIQNSVPEKFTAGDTLKFEKSFENFLPSDGGTLEYTFQSKTGLLKKVLATDLNNLWLINISSEDTESWVSGLAFYKAKAIKDDEKYTIDSGQIIILPSLENIDGFDGRTHAQKTLDAINAVIENRATIDQMSYTIAGRSLSRMDIESLITFQSHYEIKVQNEKLKGKASFKRIVTRFV